MGPVAHYARHAHYAHQVHSADTFACLSESEDAHEQHLG